MLDITYVPSPDWLVVELSDKESDHPDEIWVQWSYRGKFTRLRIQRDLKVEVSGE